MRRKLLLGTLLCIAVVAGIAWFRFPAAEVAFQRDADIARLRHLEHYGKLIEEYREKTGKAPLQGTAEVPVYVHIANDEQIAFTKNGPPTPHKVVPMVEFVEELESGLGRTIDEFYDPQYRPFKKPNFYIYMVRGNSYFFAIHVSQSFPFAKKVGESYFKVEISNVANASNGACAPDLLFAAREFTSARDKAISSGLFRQRDEKYLHFTKPE